MRKRRIKRYRAALEPLEAKHLLSLGASVAPFIEQAARTLALAHHAHHRMGAAGHRVNPHQTVSAKAIKPNFGYLVYRISNSDHTNNFFTKPFGHVLVQDTQPVPGRHYNILQVAVRNSTDTTFDANSGFTVNFPGRTKGVPILTGDETWKPGQWYIFYLLTNQYYPAPNPVTSGFDFRLGGAPSVAIPGPSGIFLRIKYNPKTINKILDYAVTKGPGNEGGKGLRLGGIANTAVYAFVSAKENRNDFGGYF